jgi:hypothetical protein
VTGVTVVGVRGHLVAVEVHVGRGLPPGAPRFAYVRARVRPPRLPPTSGRRLDPYDPTTARHLPQCEYRDEVSPAVLKILLTVKPGLGPGYDWVTCAGCEGSWQVPHYAAEHVGTG